MNLNRGSSFFFPTKHEKKCKQLLVILLQTNINENTKKITHILSSYFNGFEVFFCFFRLLNS
jgi:hypothetical protein